MRDRLDFWRRYHTLYNEYAQSELHFVDELPRNATGKLLRREIVADLRDANVEK